MKIKSLMGASALFLSTAAIAQVSPAEYHVDSWHQAPPVLGQSDPFMETASQPLVLASYDETYDDTKLADASKTVDSMFDPAAGTEAVSADWADSSKASVALATASLPLQSDLEHKQSPMIQAAAVETGFGNEPAQLIPASASYTEDASEPVAAPVSAPAPQAGYRACEGPSDDSCIQLHEPGVAESYAAWQDGQAQLAMARADKADGTQTAMNEAVDASVVPASYSADASAMEEPLDVSPEAIAQSDVKDVTDSPSENLVMI